MTPEQCEEIKRAMDLLTEALDETKDELLRWAAVDYAERALDGLLDEWQDGDPIDSTWTGVLDWS